MATQLTFGEHIRRLRRAKRWELQDLAHATGLSVSHLSRIENDHAIPNAETVVKLANALDGDLEPLLELADCLPREILERLLRRVDRDAPAHRRGAGADTMDPDFAQALVEEIDPALRSRLAQRFGLSDRDVDGIFTVLTRMAQMEPSAREAVLRFLNL